jgi:hypothetical protein
MSATMSKHKPPGRPTKRTEPILSRLLEALEEGLPQRSACIAAGLSVTTLRDWRNQDPTLGVRMEEAQEKARRQTIAIIKSAALARDWRAAAEYLKLTFPNDYRNTARIDVTATAQLRV